MLKHKDHFPIKHKIQLKKQKEKVWANWNIPNIECLKYMQE